ncbi:MAG: hypothetical protein US86_C0007G0089 [Candidatus Daviesbacteria bacterium GW2011_GWA2_38_24]|uniref:Uncharacterized protein n=1 Tax=Candidatus Daviesbacteria bacterium GW2011_GWA2_38_24 TaxID=1618422 RepID=A0A0G0LX98_9BACT|nr:MAG: hypothetical protein US86_C0007G0089 [Candidatus Daviesbacteria bacterium GW2011_GWA2_38_24]KKQ78100.1 MAG: hypothetical protein UT01_C0078G0005 [Candidatus Daviesbacteria bacterium GW2011_GWA1_38_7]OGE22696.1 MAG: hypothetical protein A2688_02815 [Candidatus Daviesbacteria bacterium RIFCSPHIGHO2_01_FULL_38_8]
MSKESQITASDKYYGAEVTSSGIVLNTKETVEFLLDVAHRRLTKLVEQNLSKASQRTASIEPPRRPLGGSNIQILTGR